MIAFWPNALTALRLGLSPVIVYSILAGQDRMVLALLILAALTDMADGWIARRLHQTSALGAVLDPIADKAVIGSVLAGGALVGRLPAWLAWAYLAKELIQLFVGALFLARNRPPIRANIFGKAATVVTFSGFYLLWLGFLPGWWMVLAGLAIGIWASWTYLKAAAGQKRA